MYRFSCSCQLYGELCKVSITQNSSGKHPSRDTDSQILKMYNAFSVFKPMSTFHKKCCCRQKIIQKQTCLFLLISRLLFFFSWPHNVFLYKKCLQVFLSRTENMRVVPCHFLEMRFCGLLNGQQYCVDFKCRIMWL